MKWRWDVTGKYLAAMVVMAPLLMALVANLEYNWLAWIKNLIELQFGLKVVLLFGAENWEIQLEKPAEEFSLLDLLNTITLVGKQLAAW